MTQTSTHRAETVHVDEQNGQCRASMAYLLEPEHCAGTHPITPNNHIEMLICGEEGFGAIAGDLEKAQASVDLVCWGFDPGMELVRNKADTWPRGETYGALLKRLATRKTNPVKVRLLIWYSYLGGQVQHHMPGYTDALIRNRTSDEVMAGAAGMGAGMGGVYLPAPTTAKPAGWSRADHCVEWWRWALDKKNAHLIEVCLRDGDKQAIQGRLAAEQHPPGTAAGGVGGLITEKSLLEGNGTHHQKTVLIDYHHQDGAKAVGYVMGLNAMTGYWDTRAHAFNDPMRERERDKPPGGDPSETYVRVKKAGGSPADLAQVRLDPYQDYACRLQGQALQFVHKNFATAWMRAGGREVDVSVPGGLKKTRFFGQTSRVQVVRTQPEEQDQTIKRLYMHATDFARKYLYLENQYFQYQEWGEHLRARRRAYNDGHQAGGAASPESAGILHAFIVIPRPEKAEMAPRTFDLVKSLGRSDQMHDEDIDGRDTGQYLLMKAEDDAQKEWAHNVAAMKRAAAEGRTMPAAVPYLPRPERSVVGQSATRIKEPSAADLEAEGLKVLIGMLVSCDDGSSGLKKRGPADRYRQIYIHSKLLMIDDAFFTVGSANLNQRSMAADSEINIATDDHAKAMALRKEVWGMHTGGAHDGGSGEPGQIADTFANWQELMKTNDAHKKNGQPLQGFLCTFRDSKFSYTRYA